MSVALGEPKPLLSPAWLVLTTPVPLPLLEGVLLPLAGVELPNKPPTKFNPLETSWPTVLFVPSTELISPEAFEVHGGGAVVCVLVLTSVPAAPLVPVAKSFFLLRTM